jgi:uncharacterized membrane protein
MTSVDAEATMTTDGIAPALHGGAVSMSARVMVLDLLRLAATFQMVQGHAIDAVLAPEFRTGAIHGAWLWLRGLTSVAFLFVAGLAFHLATLRDLPRHRRDRVAVARRFRRAGLLIALGYALHFPVASLTGNALAASAALQAAAVVDVLQCIGVTLVLLEGLALTLPGRRSIEIACCMLGAVVLAVAPLLSNLDPQGPLLPLANYLTPRAGSLFPLFPWAAHMLLGVGLCGLLLRTASERGRTVRALGAALALLGGALVLDAVGAPLCADHVSRLGWVLAGAALLSTLERAARVWPTWTRRLAGETLFIYAFHVLLVYGDGVGLASLVGERLAPLQAAAVALVVLAGSAACALGYERAWAGLARRTATG